MLRSLVSFLFVVLASGCLVLAPSSGGPGPGKGLGPPPHAPAHGYRHKVAEHGVDLVFDAGLGVYVVVGLENVYFYRDRFFRARDARWYASRSPRTDFVVVDLREVPPGLVKKSKASKARGRGRKPSRTE